ncbi:uncharacterized protein LOC111281181 [Durio zibethinus]|uniref:Uncharacterized protein LOC111281181 n=1 Tax=Durio zibethinus TaxID=66656 RepID=A0A6P5X9T5_DURZI|nr:uncharacterized protein LOC111281181 [Durio zibethinus]
MVQPVSPHSYHRVYIVGTSCKYHSGAMGHSIEACEQFHQEVQKHLDSYQLEVYEEGEVSKSVEISMTDKLAKLFPKPVTIHYGNKPKSVLDKLREILVHCHCSTALSLAVVATIAAFVGQHVVGKVVKMLGRASIIIFILAGMIFGSAISLGILYPIGNTNIY